MATAQVTNGTQATRQRSKRKQRVIDVTPKRPLLSPLMVTIGRMVFRAVTHLIAVLMLVSMLLLGWSSAKQQVFNLMLFLIVSTKAFKRVKITVPTE